MKTIVEDNEITNIAEIEAENGVVARLVALGRRQGCVSYDDILRLSPETEQDAEQFDEIVAALLSAQIPLVEDQAVGKDSLQASDSADERDGKKIAAAGLRSAKHPAEVDIDDLVALYLREAAHVPLLTREEEKELCQRIELGRVAREKMSQGNGDAARQKELHRLVKAGWEAREHLIRANARLVISVAKRYIGRGVPFLDLIQEGNIGLMRAIKKYDPHRGFKFSTYATWWIRQAVSRAVANQGRVIRVPAHMLDQISKLFRLQRQLAQELHRNPTAAELAESLELPVSRVKILMRTAWYTLSLEKPIGDEGDTLLGDLIENEESPDPDEIATSSLLRQHVEEALGTLRPREALVLRLRYGLSGDGPHTLQQVGHKLGVSRERVRQLESAALRHLRKFSIVKDLSAFFDQR